MNTTVGGVVFFLTNVVADRHHCRKSVDVQCPQLSHGTTILIPAYGSIPGSFLLFEVITLYVQTRGEEEFNFSALIPVEF